jgi:hypothetical protein
LTARVDTPGAYRVLFAQGTREETLGFAVPDTAEAHSAGANRPLLDQFVRDTGGRELRDVADIVRRPATGPAQRSRSGRGCSAWRSCCSRSTFT